MRILLWVLLLMCVFAGVSLYHSRFTDDARDARDAAHAAAVAGRPLGEGYDARVIVGEKSGAPIVEGLRPVETKPAPVKPSPPKPASPAEPRPKPAQPASPAGATAHIVKRGESLSTIAEKYYGTSKKPVVEALAKFNNLKSVNALKEGQTLSIPPLAELGVVTK